MPRRSLRALVLFLRGLVMCLALQISGVLHFATDLFRGEDAAHYASDCPDDDEDCPPGCASCHCVHGTPALPAPFAGLAESKLLPAFEVAWVPYEAFAPPSLALPSLYRPPRC